MKKPTKPIMDRRSFLKWTGGVTAAAATFPLLPGEFASAADLKEAGLVADKAVIEAARRLFDLKA